MTSETIADVLSGPRNLVSRTELHEALDAMLDVAAANGEQLDPVSYWDFIAALANGRGVADEIEKAASGMVSKYGIKDDGARFWQDFQWAVLFHLLKRLKAFSVSALPDSFSPVAFLSVAVNKLRGKGHYPDLLGLGTGGGIERSLPRAAQLLLVNAVFYRMARDRISEAEARRRVLPPEGHPSEKDVNNVGFGRTWADWKRRAAETKGVSIAQLRAEPEAAARGEIPSEPYEPDPQTIEELWRHAYRPR